MTRTRNLHDCQASQAKAAMRTKQEAITFATLSLSRTQKNINNTTNHTSPLTPDLRRRGNPGQHTIIIIVLATWALADMACTTDSFSRLQRQKPLRMAL